MIEALVARWIHLYGYAVVWDYIPKMILYGRVFMSVCKRAYHIQSCLKWSRQPHFLLVTVSKIFLTRQACSNIQMRLIQNMLSTCMRRLEITMYRCYPHLHRFICFFRKLEDGDVCLHCGWSMVSFVTIWVQDYAGYDWLLRMFSSVFLWSWPEHYHDMYAVQKIWAYVNSRRIVTEKFNGLVPTCKIKWKPLHGVTRHMTSGVNIRAKEPA